MARRPLAKKFPCCVTSCPAMVADAGDRCAVHKVWTNGPYDYACVKCKKPIEWGELWRPADRDAMRPVHAQCVGERVRASRVPKGWDDNLGLFEGKDA